jgi:hypothetical protein
MDYRRLQHSYPPRPSPLGASQEPRIDQPRQFAAPFSSHESRGKLESDKPRPYPSSASNTTSSPSQLYQSTISRASQAPLRGDAPSAYFPPRNGPTQVHRRHGSLETRNHEQTHRRNNSQPQTIRYREGRQSLLNFACLLSLAWPGSPRLQIPRIGLVPWLAASTLLRSIFHRCTRPGGIIVSGSILSSCARSRDSLNLSQIPLFPCCNTLPPGGFPPVAQIDWTTARER